MARNTNTARPAADAQQGAPAWAQYADAEAYVRQYLDADRSGRARMRAAVSRDMAAAVAADAFAEAQQVVTASRAALAAAEAASGSTAAPVDWVALTAQRAAILRRAAEMLTHGDIRPSGMPDDLDLNRAEVAQQASALLESDATWTDDMLSAAERLASQRVTRAGRTNDVSAWIAERVTALAAECEHGHVRVSDMRRGQADAPSSGAIGQALTAMLNGTRDIPGVRAVSREDSPRGVLCAALADD